MELVALELPSSYYQISKELDNNFFWLGWHNKYYFVSIPDGNYHRTGMEDALKAHELASPADMLGLR